MMDNQFDELQSILSDELTIHKEAVQTASELNEAIKGKHVDSVQMLTAKYDTCIGQIEILEARRLELCDSIAGTLNPRKHHMNLQNLIAVMPQELQKTFSDLRNSLKIKIEELVRINTSNQLLLNESLDGIKKKFDLISRFQNKFTGYKKSGTMDKKSVNKSIINQIA